MESWPWEADQLIPISTTPGQFEWWDFIFNSNETKVFPLQRDHVVKILECVARRLAELEELQGVASRTILEEDLERVIKAIKGDQIEEMLSELREDPLYPD